MTTISVIVGSTRQGRFSENPAQWILQHLRKREGIDARLLAAAYRHLSVNGFEALSLTGVAQEAGTTRQALYRRWPDKASLAAAALAAAADLGHAVRSEDPLADLAAELADFQRGVSRPGRQENPSISSATVNALRR